MVEIADIVDEESLQEWLEGQPQRFSAVIAHRAAMRILPEIWVWTQKSELAQERGQKLLPFLRVSLISEIVAYSPFAEMKPSLREAAIYAAHASLLKHSVSSPLLTSALTSSVTSAVTSSILLGPSSDGDTPSAIISAASATHSSAYNAAFPEDYSRISIFSSDDYADRMWKAIRLDCAALLDGRNLSLIPLWAGVYNPLRAEWSKVKQTLATDDMNWQFWVKWFEGAKSGMPLPWALLERIALELTEEDWKQGPQHVNGMIAEIEAGYLRDSTRLSERLLVDEHSGEVFAEPMEAKQPELIETHLNRIEDALTRALNNNNGLTEDSLETQILRDLVSKYSHDPERVEMDLVEVVGSLNGQIESDWLPDSPVINSLLNACKQGALDIRAMNPELAENRAIRARQAARELTVEDKAKLESGIEVIKPLLRADLREQFEGDLQRLLNDAIGPPPDGAPPLPAPDPAMRLANRVAKVSLMVQIDETVKKIKKHPLYGAGEVALHVAGLVALFYTIFSVII